MVERKKVLEGWLALSDEDYSSAIPHLLISEKSLHTYNNFLGNNIEEFDGKRVRITIEVLK